MKLTKRLMNTMVAIAWVWLFTHTALANNLTITNETLQAGDAGYTFVKADIQWDNSWKASWTEMRVTPSVTVTNWDAAWIFVKYRVATNNAPWQHASLSTNNSDHIIPAQAMVNVGLSTNAAGTFGAGVFLYRSAEGSGSWTNTVKLLWNYGQNGLTSTDRVDVSVHAIEMVYVPQGKFFVGSGGTEDGTFTAGNEAVVWTNKVTPSVPFQITSEDALTISNATGCLWGTFTNSGNNSIGSPGVLAAGYPKGYNAFYCMKYEMSQGQYTSFLNLLTPSQQSNRCSAVTLGHYMYSNDTLTSPTSRNEVYVQAVPEGPTSKVFACTAPDRACNFLSYADGAAYADWAGLRPMTELEFEKACRGPLTPVANDYAWGTATIMTIADGTINLTVPEDGTETNKNSVANGACNYNGRQIWTNGVNAGTGPVRCGLFATANSTRITSGSTYWGIMEMTANLQERAVVAADAGRSFTRTVGDGKLDATTGHANAASWPGIGAQGSGFRGGHWAHSSAYLPVSSRYVAGASSSSTLRGYSDGFRAVREAP